MCEENVEISDRTHKEYLEQWGRSIEDNRIAKSQQWLVSFYGFALQSALVGFIYSIVSRGIAINNNYKWLFSLLTIAILAITISLLSIYQNEMVKHRKIMKSTTKKFTDEFQNDQDNKYPDDYLKFLYKPWIFLIMSFSLLVCTGFVFYYIQIIR